ncbi:hypothetical protein A0H76_516 [Hepatospora eriocheir]|uniref:Uncharacterized protein n=1 Tax=Hepatospora eriocheir TaxID=1081669 RepID=A0A1X0Q8T6_9MICR|nr:hypothetical protein A0H76_516 [Hepatospora eriocheir]
MKYQSIKNDSISDKKETVNETKLEKIENKVTLESKPTEKTISTKFDYDQHNNHKEVIDEEIKTEKDINEQCLEIYKDKKVEPELNQEDTKGKIKSILKQSNSEYFDINNNVYLVGFKQTYDDERDDLNRIEDSEISNISDRTEEEKFENIDYIEENKIVCNKKEKAKKEVSFSPNVEVRIFKAGNKLKPWAYRFDDEDDDDEEEIDEDEIIGDAVSGYTNSNNPNNRGSSFN